MTKQLWILAGGNGAGKSTFYNVYLKKYGILFVNADLIAKEMKLDYSKQSSIKAREQAQELCQQYLSEGKSFCFETVFSHPSKIDLISQAKTLGYQVVLVYIHLQHSALNQARVIQRVKDGGHNVPLDKVVSRIPKTMENIKTVLALVDEARLVDNSFPEDPFKVVLKVKNKILIKEADPLPKWAENLIEELVNGIN